MRRLKHRSAFVAARILAIVVLLTTLLGSHSIAAANTPVVDSTPELAITRAINERPSTLFPGRAMERPERKRGDGWELAVVETWGLNTDKGEPSSMFMVLARPENNGWQAAVQGSDTFVSWLEEVPSSLLSQEARTILRSNRPHTSSSRLATPEDLPPLGLPFAIGEQWSLSSGPHGENRNALDLAKNNGVVYPSAPGIVSLGCPDQLVITHENGWQTGYYHLRDIRVTTGQYVDRTTPLGLASQSIPCGGYATGDHVHFMLNRNGNPVPLNGTYVGGWSVEAGLQDREGCLVRPDAKVCVDGWITNDGKTGSGITLPVCLVDGTWDYYHQVAFDRFSSPEIIRGGTLHAGDQFWLTGQVSNPNPFSQDIEIGIQVSLGDHGWAYTVKRTIPPASTVDVSILDDAPISVDKQLRDQPNLVALDVQLSPGCGQTSSLSIPVKPRPVVLVHGYAGSPSGWENYSGFLREMGREVFVADTLNLGNKDNPSQQTKTLGENARALRDYINTVRHQTGATEVDLVGHSMGGLVARDYVHSSMPTAPRAVHQLIMIGTPNGGSKLAWGPALIGWYLPSSLELVPDYLRTFNGLTVNRYGIPFHMIAGESNPNNPVLDGPDDCVVSLSSTSAIDLDTFTSIKRTGLCSPSLHTELARDRSIFDSAVRPLLASTNEVAARRSSPEQADVQAGTDESEILDLAAIQVEHNKPTKHQFILDNAQGVTVAVYTSDPAAQIRLRSPLGATVDLVVEPTSDMMLPPQAVYTVPVPHNGRWTLTLKTNQESASFSVVVTGQLIDKDVTLDVPPTLSASSVNTTLPVTLTSALPLSLVQVEARVAGPSGIEHTIRLQPTTKGALTYSGNVVFDSPGLYRAVVRATGRVNGHIFQRTATFLIEAQTLPLDGEVCYTVAENDGKPKSPDLLARISLRTGLSTIVGPTATDGIHALAALPNGVLLAADHQRLGSLDRTTGVFTPAPQPLGSGRGQEGVITFDNIHGLALSPSDGNVYAIHGRSGSSRADLLIRVDPATGTHVPDAFGSGVDYVVISGPAATSDVQDLAFAPDDTLYVISSMQLFTVNIANGASSFQRSLGLTDAEGMTITKDGSIYITTGVLATLKVRNRLWYLDPQQSAAVLIGIPTSGQDYESLACTTP